ncbi:hypothetical protein [Nonomuraea guangzhouensis]|uniref:Uncharacterized protein n=1 Tax=Nonomuraea guangzhouensis TaxID=1291555 RepID=A0ABW4GSJ7_9ACTN|nr:hypothetical protein [Nonomuraea guangzhouensis]
MWQALSVGGRWVFGLICLGYVLVSFITLRGLIAAPRYRILYGRVQDCRARARVLKSTSSYPDQAVITDAVLDRLADLERNDTVAWRIPRIGGVISIPLSKLSAAWRVLHAAERQLVRLESDEEIAILATSTALRTQGAHDARAKRVAQDLTAAGVEPARRRHLLIALLDHLHAQEERSFELDYEQQRVALWLALVGLFGVFGIGAAFDHRTTLLLGAIGGFLSPVVGAMRAQKQSSWGVMVLSPVGGALAAAGGLLLTRMLSDQQINILGQVFRENSWGAPDKPLALALALLFGFSGTLFSRMALAASIQLAIHQDNESDDERAGDAGSQALLERP